MLINNEPVTLFDIKKLINPEKPETVSSEQLKSLKEKIIDKVVTDAIIRQEIKSKNIEVSPEELDSAVNKVAAQNRLTVEELKAQVTKENMTWEIYLNDVLKKELEMIKVKQMIAVTMLDIDEAVLKAMYDSDFKQDKLFTASHIIIKSENEAQEAAVYEQIQKIYDSIASGASTFEEAAKTYSQDGSALQGGSLGSFSPKQMVPEFSEELAKMKIGEISKPFKTRFGWHIVRLEKSEDQAPPKYDDVKSQIINMYRMKNQDKAFDSWIKIKKETTKTEIFF